MEKVIQGGSMRIFITGSESTGKSTLTEGLSEFYKSMHFPELAREYLDARGPGYTEEDVREIARLQIRQIRESPAEGLVFFDTGLIITLVWLEVKYGSSPSWLKNAIKEDGRGCYLVCQPDIPWVHDPLRENPDRRDELNEMYINKIKEFGFTFATVNGVGRERVENAVRIIDRWILESPVK
jgi:nicotinamide riboside kinase